MTMQHKEQADGGILGRLSRLLLLLSIAFLALVAALVILQVVCRNVFDLGLPWADELARFSGIALVYFAVPLLALRGQHISVDLLPNSLPAAPRRLLLAFNEIAVIAFCTLTLYGFYGFLQRAAHFTTSAMNMPNWIFYAPPLIGLVALTAVAAARLARLARGEAAPVEPSPEPLP